MAETRQRPPAVAFDPRVGGHGGTRFRGAGGRFALNPNRGRLSHCPKSPTGAHHWVITGSRGRCRHCGAGREFNPRPRTRQMALRGSNG